MAKIIAIVNQKGGVGKTTTTVNLTAALAALGKRVLLCDFDPQANATSGMGVDKNTASPNVYDVLINGADPRRGVVTTHYGDVLPSNKALAGAGVEMIALPDREHLLRKALEVLDWLPMDRIMIETDSPYLTPEPFRGKRNDSGYVHLVAETIAQVKGVPPEEVAAVTLENGRRFFGIS